MTKKLIRLLLGLNGASIVRGLRLGSHEFIQGCFSSLSVVHPFQDRTSHTVEKDLKSIPEITMDEILGPRKTVIQLSVQRYEDGMLPAHEAMALLAILKAENPEEVLEIGTFMGHTTKAMAVNLADSIIHTVDLPPDFSEPQNSKSGPPKDDFHLIARRVVGREYKGQAVEPRIRQHFGDTAEINFQEFGRPDFFFIDGSHTYEYCKQDSEKCFALCGGAGTFLWHDCDAGHSGVIRFVKEWRGLGRNIIRIKGTSLAYWKSK
jgi:Methyltransferase domain